MITVFEKQYKVGGNTFITIIKGATGIKDNEEERDGVRCPGRQHFRFFFPELDENYPASNIRCQCASSVRTSGRQLVPKFYRRIKPRVSGRAAQIDIIITIFPV